MYPSDYKRIQLLLVPQAWLASPTRYSVLEEINFCFFKRRAALGAQEVAGLYQVTAIGGGSIQIQQTHMHYTVFIADGEKIKILEDVMSFFSLASNNSPRAVCWNELFRRWGNYPLSLTQHRSVPPTPDLLKEKLRRRGREWVVPGSRSL